MSLSFLTIQPSMASIFLILMFTNSIKDYDNVRLVIRFVASVVRVAPCLRIRMIHGIRVNSNQYRDTVALMTARRTIFRPMKVLSPFASNAVSVLFGPILYRRVTINVPHFGIFSMDTRICTA